MPDERLRWALFILRASLAAFFAIWALEKFVDPESTIGIWEHFYHVENLPKVMSYAIGIVQSTAIACFILGVAKFWSYGFLMIIHGMSTLSTYERLFDPYAGNNHLFWAAVPTLGALIALFLLREADTKLTLASGK